MPASRSSLLIESAPRSAALARATNRQRRARSVNFANMLEGPTQHRDPSAPQNPSATRALLLRKNWSRRSDLNRRPADYESAALPTELRRHSGRNAAP